MQKVYLVLGPPGSGKTTHSKRLMRWLGIKKRYHVAWFVRTNGKNKFKMQKRRGSFIPNVSHEFLEFVKWHAKEQDCVIDGFPRTIEQAKAIFKAFRKEQIILLHVNSSAPNFENWSLEVQAKRALNRGKPLDNKLYKAKVKRFLRYEAKVISWLKKNLKVEQVYEIDCYRPLEDSIAELKKVLQQHGHEIIDLERPFSKT